MKYNIRTGTFNRTDKLERFMWMVVIAADICVLIYLIKINFWKYI